MQVYHRRINKDSYYVYRMACRDSGGSILYKVGYARNPIQRYLSVQCGCPLEIYDVELYAVPNKEDALRCESRCHARLRGHHVRGEWFKARHDDEVSMMAFDSIHSIVSERQKVSVDWYKLPVDVIKKSPKPFSRPR